METVHSSTHNNEPVIWEYVRKTLTDSVQSFIDYFKEEFVNQKLIYTVSNSTLSQIQSMLKSIDIIFTKLKKALIYTQYSLAHEDIQYLSKIISQIRNLTKLSSTKNILRYQFSNDDKISTKRITDTLKAKYHDIKSFAEQYIDIHAGKTIFTQKSWPEKTVLTGSLRNSKQLQIAIDNDFYHVPKSACNNPSQIKCIAIYQSKNLFDKNAGVKYYGKVLTYNEVPRYEIKEIPSLSGDIYYRFEIDTWKTLKKPIVADALGEVTTMTTLYQLLTAEKTSELHLESKKEHDILVFMKSFAFTPYHSHIITGKVSLLYNGNNFEVYKDNTLTFKFTNEDFYRKSVTLAKQVIALLD